MRPRAFNSDRAALAAPVALVLSLASAWPAWAGGSDIIRIITPDGVSRIDVVPNVQNPVKPKPDASKSNAVAGRFVKLPVNLGTMATDSSKAWLGVNLDSDAIDRTFAISVGLMNPAGALVNDTTPGGPASQAGLRAGDIVSTINGVAITNTAQLRQYVAQLNPGAQAIVEVWRFVPDGSNYLSTLRRMAEQGNASIMAMLGAIYAGAKGVPKDDAEAARWYRSGAAAGHAGSMVELAGMLIEGRGTERNTQEAVRLYRSAADTGNLSAMWRYGMVLLEGRLVNKDLNQAAQLFQRAADGGYAPAMYNLAVMHANANGLPRNYQEAVRLYQKAIDLNYSAAMVELGLLYNQGKGVEQDDAKAVELYRRAADLGHTYGMQNLAAMLDNGQGIQRDPEQAADLVLRSLRGGNDFSYKQMTSNHTAYTREFRMAMQRRLKEEGLYSGYIDGEFGQSTQAAVTAYYKRGQDGR